MVFPSIQISASQNSSKQCQRILDKVTKGTGKFSGDTLILAGESFLSAISQKNSRNINRLSDSDSPIHLYLYNKYVCIHSFGRCCC